MCGIYGFWKARQNELDERMAAALAHRGPDARGSFTFRDFTMGATRLSIVDPMHGTQPIADETESTILVCNGEIYNYVELRELLENAGHRFRTRSDSEVILHLYQDHGADCVKYLRGMFAFAIFERDTLFIARDPLGIKPLYYSFQDGRLVFASEMKAVLECRDIAPTLNTEMCYPHSYLDYGAWTHINEIKELKPGHCMTVREDAKGDLVLATHRYWTFQCTSDLTSEQDAASLLERTLEEAVRIHLRSDVPVSFLLSGGLDSNLLVAMAREHARPPFVTYTFGLPGNNEFATTSKMATHYGSQHRETLLDPNPLEVLNLFPQVMRAVETPEPRLFDASIPTFLMYREVGKDHKVALVGEGSDELFGGYPQHFAQLAGNSQALTTELTTQVGSLYRLQLKRVDKTSMAHGVEARVPFLDKLVVDVAARIHPSLKVRQEGGKLIVRKVAEKYLPRDIFGKEKTHNTGGVMPKIVGYWLKSAGEAALGRLPIQSLPLSPRDRWQPYPYEMYQQYNLLLANLFYRIFIQRRPVATLEDVFRN